MAAIKAKDSTLIGLRIALAMLFALALGLHTWGLGWLNQLVFDEVYYVPYSLSYLNGDPFFDAHPPLGKYLIALGIALGQWPAAWLNWPTILVNDQTISPLSYRWFNALAGATLPCIAALLGFYLSAAYPPQRRLVFALLTSGLVLLTGLSLVESRLALINIYWVWFGLLGQLCWVIARTRWEASSGQASAPGLHGVPLGGLAAGISFGCAMAVKWNGAGFWLGIILLELWAQWRIFPTAEPMAVPKKIRLWCLGVVPLLTYGLLWIPHLRLNQVSLLAIHRQLWAAHQSIGNLETVHPYCSAWYTWPLMLRPVSYFYKSALGENSLTTYTVQAMGNPLLWWFATAAVVALGAGRGSRWLSRYRSRSVDAQQRRGKPGRGSLAAVSGPTRGASPAIGKLSSPVVTFALVNYGANWLPWVVVSRCTFFYHALGMAMFAVLALAWLLTRWLLDHRWHHRLMAWIMIVFVMVGFVFWLPIWVGLPLSPEALQQRWWLKSWI